MKGDSSPISLNEHRATQTADDMVEQLEKHASRPPRGPPTPSLSTPVVEYDQPLTMGSQPSPPTPAASPAPPTLLPNWGAESDDGDLVLVKTRHHFKHCPGPERTRFLAGLLSLCTSQQLSFVHQFVTSLLKRDPFTTLPDELCMRVLSFIDDPKVLLRASQVSRRWRDLLSDEVTWKNLCDRHDYYGELPEIVSRGYNWGWPALNSVDLPGSRGSGDASHLGAIHPDGSVSFDDVSKVARRPQARSYKSFFRQKFLVNAAWRRGGSNVTRNITQEFSTGTSLHLTDRYIIVALDNAQIHVMDRDGNNQRMLLGHVMGVWAMIPSGDLLVSGGCDRDVRVWNLVNGECLHTLRGHTSTVRCLKMADANTAVSGSRDTNLRVWDIRTGVCRAVLAGHQRSVRCLEVKGDIVVSGSYDMMAKVWSISQGVCLHTLQGHTSQIYSVAFDGHRIVTGSLDTKVRVWDPRTGECLAILHGHTSLVGQLQLRGNILVTGGSDGSVRVWSLETMAAIHRLAAHDNSVTTLQFDDTRIVSGGSDGCVKIWDLKTGHLIRELSSMFQVIWRVSFEAEKCVVLAQKQNRTVMEIWSFAAPPEEPEWYDSVLTPPVEASAQRLLSAPAAEFVVSQTLNPAGIAGSEAEDTTMTDAGPLNGLGSW